MFIREASLEDAPALSTVILAAFEEYRGRLDPPSGAHDQTIQAVRQKMTTAHAVVASVDHEMMGTTDQNAFTGSALGTKWGDPNKRSAFFGHFSR